MPTAPLKICHAPGCCRRQAGPYCVAHARTSPRNHRGISRHARGYDAGYQRERAALLAPGPDGSPARCAMRLEGCTGIATTAQHQDDGSLVPACGHCNYADGARRATRARRGAGVAR